MCAKVKTTQMIQTRDMTFYGKIMDWKNVDNNGWTIMLFLNVESHMIFNENKKQFEI